MERADAIPNAAGGKGGHGAAKLEGVVHKYVFKLLWIFGSRLTSRDHGYHICDAFSDMQTDGSIG
jgi:hypothetical protein